MTCLMICFGREVVADVCVCVAEDEEVMRRWRAQTMGILRRASGRDPGMVRETERVTAEVIAAVNAILEEMTVPPIAPSEARDQGLAAVVAAAVDLARLLAVQRAQFTVVFPELLPYRRTVFDPQTMEDVGGGGGEDDDDDDGAGGGREVSCVVFPGVVKRGDERGGRMEWRNVVAKMRVVCRQEGDI